MSKSIYQKIQDEYDLDDFEWDDEEDSAKDELWSRK